jgi:hypothetical protein
VGFAIDYYRQLARALCGLPSDGDATLKQAVERGQSRWPFPASAAAACAERSLEALVHIDRNAHQTTLLECWLDDLARTVDSGQPVSAYAEL